MRPVRRICLKNTEFSVPCSYFTDTVILNTDTRICRAKRTTR